MEAQPQRPWSLDSAKAEELVLRALDMWGWSPEEAATIIEKMCSTRNELTGGKKDV